MSARESPMCSCDAEGPDVARRGPDPRRPGSGLGMVLGGSLSSLIPEVHMGTRSMAMGQGTTLRTSFIACQHLGTA